MELAIWIHLHRHRIERPIIHSVKSIRKQPFGHLDLVEYLQLHVVRLGCLIFHDFPFSALFLAVSESFGLKLN